MLIYVIQIKKIGNSGVDNEDDHVEDANAKRVINTQVNNTNLYYLLPQNKNIYYINYFIK